MIRKSILAFLLTLTLGLSACGPGFATQLRLAISLSVPLIDSLVDTGAINPNLRAGLITDFSDIAADVATMASSFDDCHGSKPCKLLAVDVLATDFNAISLRGCSTASGCHFGAHQRLVNINRIIRGIIDAAHIYYGGTGPAIPADKAAIRSVSTAKPLTQSEAKAAMERGLKELKIAMQP